MKNKIINFWKATSTKIRVVLTTLVILLGLAFVALCVYGVVFVVISAIQNGSFW